MPDGREPCMSCLKDRSLGRGPRSGEGSIPPGSRLRCAWSLMAHSDHRSHDDWQTGWVRNASEARKQDRLGRGRQSRPASNFGLLVFLGCSGGDGGRARWWECPWCVWATRHALRARQEKTHLRQPTEAHARGKGLIEGRLSTGTLPAAWRPLRRRLHRTPAYMATTLHTHILACRVSDCPPMIASNNPAREEAAMP